MTCQLKLFFTWDWRKLISIVLCCGRRFQFSSYFLRITCSARFLKSPRWEASFSSAVPALVNKWWKLLLLLLWSQSSKNPLDWVVFYWLRGHSGLPTTLQVMTAFPSCLRIFDSTFSLHVRTLSLELLPLSRLYLLQFSNSTPENRILFEAENYWNSGFLFFLFVCVRPKGSQGRINPSCGVRF